MGEVGRLQRPLTEIEQDLAQVKRELAEVKTARNILKKAGQFGRSMHHLGTG